MRGGGKGGGVGTDLDCGIGSCLNLEGQLMNSRLFRACSDTVIAPVQFTTRKF